MATIYTAISGTSTDSRDLADRFDLFLVGALGWNRHYTVDSGINIRDRVYYNNSGESPARFNPIYYRLKTTNGAGTTSGIIYQYVYTYFDVSGAPTAGELGGTEDLSNPAPINSECKYWLYGNKDVAWILLKNTTTSGYFSAGVGYCQTYYTDTQDPYPVFLAGQQTESTKLSGNRIQMYDRTGTPAYYYSEDCSVILDHGNPQLRDGSYFGVAPQMVNTAPTTKELRGELVGIKQVYGGNFISEDILTVSGVGEDYVVIKHADDFTNSYAYGPFQIAG